MTSLAMDAFSQQVQSSLVDLLQDAGQADTVESRLHVLRALRAALRVEREMSREYSPAYCAGRHAALLRACREEEIDLLKKLREELTQLSQAS